MSAERGWTGRSFERRAATLASSLGDGVSARSDVESLILASRAAALLHGAALRPSRLGRAIIALDERLGAVEARSSVLTRARLVIEAGGLDALDGAALSWLSMEIPATTPATELLGATYQSLLAGRGGRGGGGSFFTPPAVIDRLCSSVAVGARVCDPACGVGALLAGAARKLLSQAGEHAAPQVVGAQLYGVDRDATAVDLCRLALRLEFGLIDAPLPELHDHVVVGDALLGAAPELGLDGAEADTYSAALFEPEQVSAEQRALVRDARRSWQRGCALGPERGAALRRFADERGFVQWRDRFPELYRGRADDGFEVVLANPPYLALYSKKSRRRELEGLLPAGLDGELGDVAGCPGALPARRNTCFYFLSLAARLIARGGRFELVLPDSVLTNAAYERLRRALLQGGTVERVTLFQEAMFVGASVGTALVSWRRRPPSAGGRVELVEVAAGEAGEAPDRRRSLTAAELAARPKAHWHPGSDCVVDPQLCVPLGDMAEIRDGINPGPAAVRRRLIDAAPVVRESEPLIVGADISPHQLRSATRWVRYDPSLITPAERKRGASLRNPRVFDGPRLVYRQTADRPIAAVDLEGHYALNSVHNISLRSPGEDQLFALCAYLNSERCAALARSHTGERRRTFPQLHIASMRSLPVPRRLSASSDPLTARLARVGRLLARGSAGSKVRGPAVEGWKRRRLGEIAEGLVEALLSAEP